ncbi:unnamed protein product [Nippostrongylus brasiliensis]|uniref:Secreted protein n=1 Tax=Nippostrongylus brasiliensis TaxID=27835 RepID=A0A0N4XV28_NIPBR|nr:unnamed protein product [Nippostrongylus brasiliensis]
MTTTTTTMMMMRVLVVSAAASSIHHQPPLAVRLSPDEPPSPPAALVPPLHIANNHSVSFTALPKMLLATDACDRAKYAYVTLKMETPTRWSSQLMTMIDDTKPTNRRRHNQRMNRPSPSLRFSAKSPPASLNPCKHATRIAH